MEDPLGAADLPHLLHMVGAELGRAATPRRSACLADLAREAALGFGAGLYGVPSLLGVLDLLAGDAEWAVADSLLVVVCGMTRRMAPVNRWLLAWVEDNLVPMRLGANLLRELATDRRGRRMLLRRAPDLARNAVAVQVCVADNGRNWEWVRRELAPELGAHALRRLGGGGGGYGPRLEARLRSLEAEWTASRARGPATSASSDSEWSLDDLESSQGSPARSE